MNVFSADDCTAIIARINKLTPETKQLWGKMNVAQMLAHCNVTYDLVENTNRPKGLMKLMLKWFVKPVVVGPKPYKKNGRTAPAFIISDEREFGKEKNRLVDNIWQVQKLGEAHFNNKSSNSFGSLSVKEWNNMFYKHLDHHLGQFGV